MQERDDSQGPSDSGQGSVRAQIIDTGDDRVLSAQIVIMAPASVIFDIISRPHRHADVDGSGTVRGVVDGPERLELGARFRMRMHMRIPYRITSTVVEFELDRRIAWAHMLGNRWSYELTPMDSGSTLVQETNDLRAAGWRGALSPIARNPGLSQRAIATSLVRLKALAECTA